MTDAQRDEYARRWNYAMAKLADPAPVPQDDDEPAVPPRLRLIQGGRA